jgi:hypothetical protein
MKTTRKKPATEAVEAAPADANTAQLVAALRNLVDGHRQSAPHMQDWDAAEAAIKKAEGK